MNRAGKYVLRLLAGVVLFLALGAPTPGNVGGCGSTVSVADARLFCVDRDQWKCVRDEFAERISVEERDACIAAVEPGCSAFAWPPGCAPTDGQARACITLLSRRDLAPMTYEQLLATYQECNLCM